MFSTKDVRTATVAFLSSPPQVCQCWVASLLKTRPRRVLRRIYFPIRTEASILHHLGLIPSNRLVEVQRGDLVGQYVGQRLGITSD